MELLTRKEAAARLKIGLRTLDRRIAEGQLDCYRLGDGPRAPVRISEDQLRKYLARFAHGVPHEHIERARSILSGKD